MDRRKFVSATLSTGIVALSGCSLLDSAPKASFSGNVTTEEPLIKDTEVTTDSPYPHHYSGTITSKAEAERRLNWSFIEEEVPILGRRLDETDYDSEFLVLFGLVLPETRRLEIESKSKDGDVLRYTFRTDFQATGARGVGINTQISRNPGEPPDGGLEFTVQY